MLDSHTLGYLLVVPFPPILGAQDVYWSFFSQSKSGAQKRDHS